jgi:hypothetical protein
VKAFQQLDEAETRDQLEEENLRLLRRVKELEQEVARLTKQ